jgi:hypothetical protein
MVLTACINTVHRRLRLKIISIIAASLEYLLPVNTKLVAYKS